MNLAIRSCRTCPLQRKHTFAGLLLLFSMLASSGAMADFNDRSAGAFDQSAPAHQGSNAESDQDFLPLFRAASLSLSQAIALAERLHVGSRAAAITFDISSTPSLNRHALFRKVKPCRGKFEAPNKSSNGRPASAAVPATARIEVSQTGISENLARGFRQLL